MTPEECDRARVTCQNGITAKIDHLGELLAARFDALKDEVTRRMDESLAVRGELHRQQNELSKEVTRALTKLNGAALVQVHAHKREGNGEQVESTHFRKSDTLSGWVRQNWLILTAILLAAFAGEKVIPALIEGLRRVFTQ